MPTAILSRQTAGLRSRALVVNLPGSPGSIEVCLGAVLPAVPGCVTLAGGPPLPLREGTRSDEFYDRTGREPLR